MNNIKIFYIHEVFYSSDARAIHGTNLVNGLKSLGAEVFVFAKKKITIPNKEAKSTASRNSQFLIGELINSLKSLFKLLINFLPLSYNLLKFKPDCILIRPSYYDLTIFFLKIITKAPVILEINAPFCYERRIFFEMNNSHIFIPNYLEKIEKISWSLANKIYVVSSNLKNILVNSGVDEKKIFIIPNGVDIEEFHKTPQYINLPGAAVKICFVGSLHPWHGIEFLLRSFQIITEKYLNVNLYIIGTGYTLPRLKNLVKSNSFLQNKVVFLGGRSHLETISFIKGMDILVAPYIFPDENSFYFSPIKIFEYMASGRAIVAASIGQISEIFINGTDAILYPMGDHFEFEHALSLLIESKELREKLGAASLKKSNEYTWLNTSQLLLNEIKTTINY